MSMYENLLTSERGMSWLQMMPPECISALQYIQDRLTPLWARGVCYPAPDRVMLPFHMLSPDETKMVIICKESYRSESMATGIPVETGNNLETPSARVFMRLISEFWKDVNISNFMKCYYASGILVINASFTSESILDKRYSLTYSHCSLWSRFCYPLISHINRNTTKPIVGLGTEGRALVRNAVRGDTVHHCPFPIDGTTSREFTEIIKRLIHMYIFDVQC